jgi:acetylornithine/succinyldiaminopimelate/putrescine aminotransferase
MDCFTENPVLGHITTFGGNAVCCAASLATLQEISSKELYKKAIHIEQVIIQYLQHPAIKEIRSCGGLMAVEFENTTFNMKVISNAIQLGVITDWFLFCDTAMRLSPPLVITDEELIDCCLKLNKAIELAI